jgi:hypothetical protein
MKCVDLTFLPLVLVEFHLLHLIFSQGWFPPRRARVNLACSQRCGLGPAVLQPVSPASRTVLAGARSGAAACAELRLPQAGSALVLRDPYLPGNVNGGYGCIMPARH